MGTQPCDMFSPVAKLLPLLAACVLLAQATPLASSIHSLRDLPPTIGLQQLATTSPRQDAMATYKFLQQNNNDDAQCRALADEMIDQAKDAIEKANENLANVDTGADCPNKYAEEVQAAEDTVEENKKTTKELTDAYTDAKTQRVTLTVNFIPNPDVSHFTITQPWQDAKDKYQKAEAAVSPRSQIDQAGEDALVKAKETQKTEIVKCNCNTQKEHAEAVALNNDEDTIAKLKKDYKLAHELICVLDDVNPCNNYNELTGVTVPELTAEAKAAVCSAEAGEGEESEEGTMTKLYDAGGCADQGGNLGTDFKTAADCWAAAQNDARCGDAIMWSPTYNYSWGCRCCSPGGTGDENTDDNQNWQRWGIKK